MEHNSKQPESAVFCVFFSFFYGAGAIFILVWNASVISAAIGSFVRSNIEKLAAAEGLMIVVNYTPCMQSA